MICALRAFVLRSLTPVLVQGGDARKFLQGQLTNDVRRLRSSTALYAAVTTGQGRVQTLLTLIERAEGIFALLPPSAAAPTLERMRRMTLRADVRFVEQQRWAVASVAAGDARELFAPLPQARGGCLHHDAASLLRWWSAQERFVLLANRDKLSICEPDTDASDAQWRAAELAAGLPTLYPQTRESFVPQQLNLDLLGALSYDKGCYVGQEVVARARRAAAPRRMYRFSASCSAPLAGTPVLAQGSEIGAVVDAVPTAGGCELLAVIDPSHSDAQPSLQGGHPLQPLSLPCWSVQ